MFDKYRFIILKFQFEMDLKNKFFFKQRADSFSRREIQGRGLNEKEGQEPIDRRSVLNKFKKKTQVGKVTPNQFKKFMLEANNVFFENRSQLKNMENLKELRWTLICLWLFFAITYFLIGRLEAYDGVCPKNARCGVFIHCAQFFEYDPNSHSCILSSQIVHEIRQIAQAQIIQLQYNYGDNECAGIQTVPSLNLDFLFADVQDFEKKKHYRSEANNFFKDKTNQKELGFTLTDSIVEPSIKLYSMSCQLERFLRTPDNQICLFYGFLGLVGILILLSYINKRRKIAKIYNYLREKVLASPNEILNVTHTMGDLQAEFGVIDEATWEKVNNLRTENKEIGYYEDDFLYWRKM